MNQQKTNPIMETSRGILSTCISQSIEDVTEDYNNIK